jgi:hypothetical protein
VSTIARILLLLAFLLPASRSLAAPGLFDGADHLLDNGPGAAAMMPAALYLAGGDSLEFHGWGGLSTSMAVANEELGLAVYNRYAGSRLDAGDRRELLDRFGNSLVLHARLHAAPLAIAWRPTRQFLDHDWVLGAGWELQSIGRAGMDASVMRTLFFGNTPGEPVEIRGAGVRALHLSRWRVQAAVANPGGHLPGWRFGAGLGLQDGAMARTTTFSARLEPPEGTLAGHFIHELTRSTDGRGWFMDLGAGWDGTWNTMPLRADFAVRGLVNRMHWSDVSLDGMLLSLEPTPISSAFDVDTFEDALVDSTWNTTRRGFSESLPPTLEAGLVARPTPRWEMAALGEFTPAGGPHPGQRRLSVYGRYRPDVRGLHLGGEITGGQGRGPGLGVDVGWHSRDIGSSGTRVVLGLALKNRAGVFHYSRGMGLGVACGIEF